MARPPGAGVRRRRARRQLAGRGSAAAEFRWIIVGRRGVVVGPPTTGNGVIAIDPRTMRRDAARARRLAGTNDDLSRLGMMPSSGGVRLTTESDDHAKPENRSHQSTTPLPSSLRKQGPITTGSCCFMLFQR